MLNKVYQNRNVFYSHHNLDRRNLKTIEYCDHQEENQNDQHLANVWSNGGWNNGGDPRCGISGNRDGLVRVWRTYDDSHHGVRQDGGLSVTVLGCDCVSRFAILRPASISGAASVRRRFAHQQRAFRVFRYPPGIWHAPRCMDRRRKSHGDIFRRWLCGIWGDEMQVRRPQQ